MMLYPLDLFFQKKYFLINHWLFYRCSFCLQVEYFDAVDEDVVCKETNESKKVVCVT